jgi:hypothetical protein
MGATMRYNETVVALKREKDLLEQILLLSENQLRLIQHHDLESFEAFWPLLGEPMAELAEAESAVDFSMAELEKDHVLTQDERRELGLWSAAIADLAHRIANIDEMTAWYVDAERYDSVSAS